MIEREKLTLECKKITAMIFYKNLFFLVHKFITLNQSHR